MIRRPPQPISQPKIVDNQKHKFTYTFSFEQSKCEILQILGNFK